MGQNGTIHPSPSSLTSQQEEQRTRWSMWFIEGRTILTCAVDAVFNVLLAVRQPIAFLRGMLFGLYLIWVLVRPYRFHPQPLPDLWPFPYFLLPGSGSQGWQLTFKSLWAWTRFLVRWEVVRFWLLWLGPVALAVWINGSYLARIFGWGRGTQLTPEEAEAQARSALLYRAFAPLYFWVLRISHGRVQDERAPIFWLGGPGRVQLATDSAAIWETFHSGRIHLMMPRPRPPLNVDSAIVRWWLDWRLMQPVGFERLRRIVDLRQQHLEFDLHARTRDGVPLFFAEVHALYSLRPDEAVEPTPDLPYPRSEQAIRQLIEREGGQARPLHAGLPLAEGHAVHERRAVDHTTSTMRTALRARLKHAIASRTLPEVLAAIEANDAQKVEHRVAEVTDPQHPPFYQPLPPYPPMPQPRANKVRRYELTRLLRESDGYHQRGLHLYWADASDWDIPFPGIKAQFVRAWQLTRENTRRGGKVALEQLRQEAYLAFLAGEFNRWAQMLSDDRLEELAANVHPSWAFERRLRRWLARLRALIYECMDRGNCHRLLAPAPLSHLQRMVQFLDALDLEPGHRP